MRELASDQDNGDEVASFIAEGTYRLATISTNDYGVGQSARMAQTYLERAIHVLEAKPSFCGAIRNEISALHRDAQAMAREYAQLEKFNSECERFNRRATQTVAEWISKWVVRTIASGYIGTVSHQLAHKIRVFHSRASATLLAQ